MLIIPKSFQQIANFTDKDRFKSTLKKKIRNKNPSMIRNDAQPFQSIRLETKSCRIS